ncbi:hypothetical protein [Gimesia maris]|uniref:PD-(D/E)XK nuclease domain-containing protein n=1 Tax=Gimesia maris TaxID=122 RepID=UPI0032F9BC2F|tara:strand:+ start:195 stop:947 length:753 start_codon:yes stop_codon:yes gene_type:complete
MEQQQALKLLNSILSEIETEDFSSLREVDGKIKETRMVLSGCNLQFLSDEMNSDLDFSTNSRRVRLEALANYVRSAIRYMATETGQNHQNIQSIEQRDEEPFKIVEHICTRFHLIAKQLSSRYADRETLLCEDEYDVQDLLHAILHLHFDDIRKEEWSPSYAGGCSRVDFLLKDEKIVIEVKKTRKSLTTKLLGDQLIIDSEKYRAHPDCKKIFCFVYDPDSSIINPRGIEKDLYKKEIDFEVKVLIVPK